LKTHKNYFSDEILPHIVGQKDITGIPMLISIKKSAKYRKGFGLSNRNDYKLWVL